jgi:hypothetical protein
MSTTSIIVPGYIHPPEQPYTMRKQLTPQLYPQIMYTVPLTRETARRPLLGIRKPSSMLLLAVNARAEFTYHSIFTKALLSVPATNHDVG